MIQRVDSRLLPADTRVDALWTMAQTVIQADIDWAEPGPICRGSLIDLGSLQLSTVGGNAPKIERTPRHQALDHSSPCLMLGLQPNGSSLLVQDGREAVVRPGDLVIYSSTSPYTIIDLDGHRQRLFRMPLEKLGLPVDVVRHLTATRLCPGHPIADMALNYFRRLVNQAETLDVARADAIDVPSMALLRAVLTTHLDVKSPATRHSLQETLQLRVMEYVRTHLTDPGLSAAQIAAEHHISVRHLYTILAAAGISLGDWIRSRRLEACRKELSLGISHGGSISSIAARWGFRDASNFGRHFRAAYGVSPREYRQSMERLPLSERLSSDPSAG